MKTNGIVCLLICLSIRGYAQQSKEVFISGKILNLNNRTSVADISDVGALRPANNEREIIIGKDGNFSVHFILKKANYFQVGRNLLYISPGDKLKVTIDFNDPEKSAFSGRGASEDDYLKTTPSVHAGSYINGGLNLKKTIPESVDYVLFLANERRNTLNALNKLPAQFVRLENGRIDADIINSFKLLPGPFTTKNKMPQSAYQQNWKETDSLTKLRVEKYSMELNDPKFLKLEGVRTNFYKISDEIIKKGVLAPELKDWQYAYELAWYLDRAKDKKEILRLGGKIDSIQNLEYRGAVKELFDLKSGFSAGDTAVDFHVKDANGNNLSLSQFKGTVIYIDLWATWCVPCLQDMPHLDSLRKKYAHNPNITFISLTLNSDINDWKNYLQKHNPSGIQLFPDHRHQLDAYNITVIPRTIIIDKDFKVIAMDGPRPSDPEIVKYLDGLLVKK